MALSAPPFSVLQSFFIQGFSLKPDISTMLRFDKWI
jgi:hypothetical protein